MALVVRKILASEYSLAAAVVQTTFAHLAVHYQPPAGVATFARLSTADEIASRDARHSVTYVALIQEVIIGVLQVRSLQHIAMLFVLPEMQSRGVGRALLKAAEQEAPLQTVSASVNSVMAYMRYGFMPCGADQVSPSGIRFVPMQKG
ncbi:GNAT family N-acetyltransferase [Deefgea salmonis]|uniref:GNAT family N-acetyltransferase n=1 Tax=Deefgea salmonis TaxID=2875502 RepID=A0ABS8BGM7_9NEIS|nr:GNAT family N-acetyltransferase [Deefgea salmonis]MCB5194867.1 GNAT family N-acetyltransferase [Deefgea salmonis]